MEYYQIVDERKCYRCTKLLGKQNISCKNCRSLYCRKCKKIIRDKFGSEVLVRGCCKCSTDFKDDESLRQAISQIQQVCTDLRDYNIDFVQPISLIDAIQNRHTPKNANTFDTENLSNIRPLNTKMYNFPGVRQYKDRKRKPTLAPKLELGEKKYPILLDTTKLTTRIHPFYFQDSTEIYPKAEPLKSLCHMNRSHLWENDMYFELNTAIREDIDANYKVSIASNEKSITDKAYRNRAIFTSPYGNYLRTSNTCPKYSTGTQSSSSSDPTLKTGVGTFTPEDVNMMASDLHTINSSVFSEFSPPYSYQLDTFPSTPQLANLSTRNKVQESNLQESALNWSQLTDLPSCITDDCIFHSAGTKIRGELGTMKSNIKTNASQRSTDCSSRTGRIGEYNPFIETPFSFEELDLNYASMQRTNTQGNKRNVDGSIKPQQFSKNREQENDEEDIFFSGLV